MQLEHLDPMHLASLTAQRSSPESLSESTAELALALPPLARARVRQEIPKAALMAEAAAV